MPISVKATNNGNLTPISPNDAWVEIPWQSGKLKFLLKALPEITEQKGANYGDVDILGRSSPIKTYRGSTYRSFNIVFNLHSTTQMQLNENIDFIRAIASLVHPQYENTYLPPPVAKIKIGTLISGPNGGGVSAICQSYSYTMSPDVVWIGEELVPLYIPLTAEFHCVYPFRNLPGSNDVIQGRY